MTDTEYADAIAQYARHTYGSRATVVVAGCGSGETVKALYARGIDAYGFDADWEAVMESSIGRRVITGDARDPHTIPSLRQLCDAPQIDMVLTERLLSTMQRADAQQACSILRCHGDLFHRVLVDSPENPYCVTRLSLHEWQQYCDPAGADRWEDADTYPLLGEVGHGS